MAGEEGSQSVGAARLLRVRYCSACGTWYGAYYSADTVAAEDGRRHFCEHCCRPCEFLDHLPNRHGECRALVCTAEAGGHGALRADSGVGLVSAVRWREALGPAQQELGF